MSERIRIVEKAMRRVGPQVTPDDVDAELRLCGDDRPLSDKWFTRIYNRVFRRLGGGADEAGNGTVAACSEQALNSLSDFIRFAGTVEAVGGLAKAEKYLEVLRQLRGTFEQTTPKPKGASAKEQLCPER